MTIKQQESHILTLVHKLPLLRRIKLALTILREIEPTQIPIEDQDDEVLAELILSRKEAYLQGTGENISRQDLMAKIKAEISADS